MINFFGNNKLAEHIKGMETYCEQINEHLKGFILNSKAYWAPELHKEYEALQINLNYTTQRLEILKKIQKKEMITTDEHALILKLPVFNTEPQIKDYPNIEAPAQNVTMKHST